MSNTLYSCDNLTDAQTSMETTPEHGSRGQLNNDKRVRWEEVNNELCAVHWGSLVREWQLTTAALQTCIKHSRETQKALH